MAFAINFHHKSYPFYVKKTEILAVNRLDPKIGGISDVNSLEPKKAGFISISTIIKWPK